MHNSSGWGRHTFLPCRARSNDKGGAGIAGSMPFQIYLGSSQDSCTLEYKGISMRFTTPEKNLYFFQKRGCNNYWFGYNNIRRLARELLREPSKSAGTIEKCGCGGIGRRARFRSVWWTVMRVRIPPTAPTKNRNHCDSGFFMFLRIINGKRPSKHYEIMWTVTCSPIQENGWAGHSCLGSAVYFSIRCYWISSGCSAR